MLGRLHSYGIDNDAEAAVMRADVTQAILEAYDSWWRGDVASALQCFHPEALVTVAGDPAQVPFAGEYRGLDGVAAFLARFAGTAAALIPTLSDLIVDGERAVVRWTMPVGATPVPAELQIVDVLRLQQGRILALEEVFDTSAAARLFGPPARAHPERRIARRRSGHAAPPPARPSGRTAPGGDAEPGTNSAPRSGQ